MHIYTSKGADSFMIYYSEDNEVLEILLELLIDIFLEQGGNDEYSLPTL